MVFYCCAYGCTNKQLPGADIKFHGLPLNNYELNKKWHAAIRRINFTTTASSKVCSVHFKPSDYLFTNSTKLKPDAVPSIFYAFPPHLSKDTIERKPPKKRVAPCPDDSACDLSLNTTISKKRGRQSPTKDELKKKIKSLNQQIRRKSKKIDSLNSAIDDLKRKNLLKNLCCLVCADALIFKNDMRRYFLTLITVKDNGGLIYFSEDVIKIIIVTELVFKGTVCVDDYLNPGISSQKNLKAILRNKVLREVGGSVFRHMIKLLVHVKK